jgi:hypothetical protein
MNCMLYYIYSYVSWDDLLEDGNLYALVELGRRVSLRALFDCIQNEEARKIAIAYYITLIVKTNRIRMNSIVDVLSAFNGRAPRAFTYDDALYVMRRFDAEYNKCLYEPNTCIGIIASTSVSESSTQNVLNAFHYSGTTSGAQAAMSVGLPRILEILSVSKDKKKEHINTNLRFQFKKQYKDIHDVYIDAFKLVHKTVGSYLKRYDFVYGAPNHPWMPIFKDCMADSESEYIQYTIDMHMDTFSMYKHGVRLVDICGAIQSKYLDLYCVFSPDKHGIITVFILQCMNALRKYDTDDVEIIDYLNFVLQAILNIHINGLTGIRGVYVNKHANGSYIIDTEGGRLRSAINHPGIIGDSVVSNNVYETYQTLGIEACRALIILELKKTFAHSGIAVNEKHLEVVVDVMTNSGEPRPVSRYGIETDSFIARSCFEQSLKMLTDAAIQNRTDNMRSSSSSILLGHPICTGTGRNIELLWGGERLRAHAPHTPPALRVSLGGVDIARDAPCITQTVRADSRRVDVASARANSTDKVTRESETTSRNADNHMVNDEIARVLPHLAEYFTAKYV